LFEAKLYSDFYPETKTVASQIEREISMGKMTAGNTDKEFIYVAITAEYYKDQKKYFKYEKRNFKFIWTNWQFISRFIDEKLENKSIEQNREFANDLFSLLVKKRLRSFEGLKNIIIKNEFDLDNTIFYNLNSSRFKGEFTGFIENLQDIEEIKKYSKIFKKSFFTTLKKIEPNTNQLIFYNGK